MKHEVEALRRAYLNMLTAHEDIMRKNGDAFGAMMDAFAEFSLGHHALFSDLDVKVQGALANLQRGLATPPPIPRNEIFDRFESDLRDLEQGQKYAS